MRIDRLNKIEEYIVEQGTTSLDDLATQFSVSMNTVRRDVAALAERGNIYKVYGGVSSALAPQPVGFPVRAQKNPEAKQIIGQLAAGLVEDGSSIFLDSGSTVPALLRHLGEKRNVTVISHSLAALYAASSLSNLNIISLGGVYNPITFSFSNATTLKNLSYLTIQTIFLSASGVSLESGLTNGTYPEADIKRSVIEHGNRVVLMADHSKFGHSALISFCNFDKLYAIVTDQAPPSSFNDVLSSHGIRIIYPGFDGTL